MKVNFIVIPDYFPYLLENFLSVRRMYINWSLLGSKKSNITFLLKYATLHFFSTFYLKCGTYLREVLSQGHHLLKVGRNQEIFIVTNKGIFGLLPFISSSTLRIGLQESNVLGNEKFSTPLQILCAVMHSGGMHRNSFLKVALVSMKTMAACLQCGALFSYKNIL